MDLQISDLWIASGVLLGFQVASFTTRINREINVGEDMRTTWLPPAELLNLTSMVTLIAGVFILPVFGIDNPIFITYSFGLAMLLFVGYAFSLVGHYELFNNKTSRSYFYFPLQEKIIIVVVIVLAIIYLITAAIRTGLLPIL